MTIRKTSGLFKRYFIVTISIILISFVFVGGALLVLVSRFWVDEKTELLEENVTSVAENISVSLESDPIGKYRIGTVTMICNTLGQISNAIDADIFLCNNSGYVVYCQDLLDSDMILTADSCETHSKYYVPPEIMNIALRSHYSATGKLGSSLSDLSFIISSPVVIYGETVGVVFATQPIIEGLSPYVLAILKMFSIASLLAMLLSFLSVYFLSYRLTKPLHQMSAAAKQYANGDFSSRIAIKKSVLFGGDEITELSNAFNSMAQALATLETSRRSFVANVSHELKTPMTTIGGFIDGILDGTIDEAKQSQYLTIVSDEVKRLSRLVTGMLNMSKIEAGELKLKPGAFDLSNVVFRTLLSFEQLINNKKIEIRGLDVMRQNPVMADEDMINQVVYNLIDNAVKFTPEGGYIEVFSSSDGVTAEIRIRNSGKGIASEELGKIFERFYKVDKSRSYDVKGAGMGLYISKTIVELHGGSISVSSLVNEYTEFMFKIPVSAV